MLIYTTAMNDELSHFYPFNEHTKINDYLSKEFDFANLIECRKNE